MPTIQLLSIATATLVAPALPGALPPSPSLELHLADQYGGEMLYPEPHGESTVTLVVVADRKGAEANRAWAAALASRYAPHIEGQELPRLRILPVAHLQRVPRLLRGIVRSMFRDRNEEGEPILPIALDWKGDAKRQLGLEPGVPNLTVLDRSGHIRLQTSGEVDEQGLDTFRTLDELLTPSAGPVTAPTK